MHLLLLPKHRCLPLPLVARKKRTASRGEVAAGRRESLDLGWRNLSKGRFQPRSCSRGDGVPWRLRVVGGSGGAVGVEQRRRTEVGAAAASRRGAGRGDRKLRQRSSHGEESSGKKGSCGIGPGRRGSGGIHLGADGIRRLEGFGGLGEAPVLATMATKTELAKGLDLDEEMTQRDVSRVWIWTRR